jgi:hypothetical protein
VLPCSKTGEGGTRKSIDPQVNHADLNACIVNTGDTIYGNITITDYNNPGQGVVYVVASLLSRFLLTRIQ